MKDYIQVEVVSSKEVDKFLKAGWELIETSKTIYDIGESELNYHVGYTARRKIDDLISVIKEYEKYGLKEELFKKVAETNGHNINDYDEGRDGHFVRNETVQFLEKYEAAVNNKNTMFYKKLTSEEIADKYF